MRPRKNTGRLYCPKCGEYIYGRVVDVHQDYRGVIRKRDCEKCGIRFMTKEVFISYAKRRAVNVR